MNVAQNELLSQRLIRTLKLIIRPQCQYIRTNNSILGELEGFITHKFNDVDLQHEYFTNDEINKIILWLEIIEYKFHVLNLRRKCQI